MLLLNNLVTDMLTATVCDGDSGAWVIHSAAPELYGHVVATDAIGDAYIIPALDTFSNIRDCMGAVAVQLPTVQDIQDRASQHSHYPEHARSPHEGHIDRRLRQLDLSATRNNDTSKAISTAATLPATILEPTVPRSSVEENPHTEGREGLQARCWYPGFSKRGNIDKHIPYNKNDETTNREQDTLNLLPSDYQEYFPSCRAEEVMDFCRSELSNTKFHHLGVVIGSPDTAWLHDQEYTTGFARPYTTRLTANQLKVELSQKVRQLRFQVQLGHTTDKIGNSVLGRITFQTQIDDLCKRIVVCDGK
jgi:hypothetical protein